MEKTAQPAPAIGPAITCGPENVAHFNARLRAEIPEAFALAKALRERGLIDGLRGARIGPIGAFQAGVSPVLSLEAEKRLLDAEWARNQEAHK